MRKISGSFKTILLGCALALAAPSASQASGFKVVHYFAGGSGDGALPNEVLVFGRNDINVSSGVVVTTYSGGEENQGTVSAVRADGSTTILHSFGHADPYDGKFPAGSLALDHNPDGSLSLLGTTSAGGQPNYGTIFEIGLDGSQYARVYDFQGNQSGDGREPTAGLEYSSRDGYFYGTTRAGGDANNDGTIFQFGGYSHGYSYEDVFNFSGVSGGGNPYATPFYTGDGGGFIVLTTSDGGDYNRGTLVEWQVGNEYNVWNFGGPGDGAYPEGKVAEYNGFVYGTTTYGGSDGLGTIFRIRGDGTGYSLLYSFKGVCCGRSDGSFPVGGLTLKGNNLYGTTANGGSASDLGTVFKFDPNTGAEAVLHAFTGGDGAHPFARVVFRGNTLFGTTMHGGTNDNGVLFEMTGE